MPLNAPEIRSLPRWAKKWSRNMGVAGLVGVVAVGGLVEASSPESAQDEVAVTARASGADGAVEVVERTQAQRAVLPGGAGAEGPVWDLPNLDHERVDFWVGEFTRNQEMRERFERFLSRSGRYVPMIRRKLVERGMPQDLVYLAMIESGFQPKAYSHAHASGLWQFIRATGERYGLTVNRAVDERNDPVRATDAALDYLSDLHDRFGSWYLAAAAYNTGEGRVGRIMRSTLGRERAGSEQDYYLIWPRLPRETRDYVPLMIAAARISKEPVRYGFDGVELQEPLRYEEVVLEPATPLPAVAEAAGVELAELRELNTHLKLDRTPTNTRYAVRLPVGTAADFEENWEAVEASAPVVTEVDYRVRRGDNLTTIARRHGSSITEIRRANGLRNDRIYEGQTLRIPSP